jgi:hypothetical protein
MICVCFVVVNGTRPEGEPMIVSLQLCLVTLLNDSYQTTNNQLRDIAFVEAYFCQHHHPRAPHTSLAMWKNVPLSFRKSVMPAYLRATSAFYVRCELCDCNFMNNYFVVRNPSNMLLYRIIRVSD